MNNIKYYLFFVVYCFSYHFFAQNSCPGNYNSVYINAQPVSNPPYKIGWHIVHDEEFDNVSDIDNNFWNKWNGNWQNLAFFQPSNIIVNNGRCNLNVNYSPNNYTDWTGTGFYWYTSSYMNTKKEYGPGYFWEMKGKRNDLGFKSSFWSFNYKDANGNPISQSDPQYGEGISVFDNDFKISSDINTNFSEIFGANNNAVGCQEKTFFNQTTPSPSPFQCCMPLPNSTDHTYSLDYQSNEVKMYINNKLIIKNTTNVPQSTQSMGFWATDIYWDGIVLNYGSKLEMDYVRLYKKNEPVTYPLNEYCFFQGWNSQYLRPRFVADFNGDGKKDVLGFGYQNVKASLANISNKNIGFSTTSDVIINQYTVEQGWNNQNEQPRLIGDINGDGKSDVVGFGYFNTVASLSNSTNNNISFLPLQYVGAVYTQEQGWYSQEQTPRFLADVNGDLYDDIIGFSNDGVYISASNSNNNNVAFTNSTKVLNSFGSNDGWTSQSVYPRFLSDVNGDGKKDIVGFGHNTVYVSLSECSGNYLYFTPPTAIYSDFCADQGYISQLLRPRYLADINGDGKDDIVGFGYMNVYASLSNCNNSNVSFTSPAGVISHFTVEQGYLDTDQNQRFVCDVNNDKKADIIGFSKEIMRVAVSKSDQNTASFYDYNNCVDDMSDVMGYAWGNDNKNKKELVDINGDGSLDVIGFGNNHVTTSQSPGGTYNLPFTVLGSTRNTANNWDTPGGDGRDCSYKFYVPEEYDVQFSTCYPESDFWETISIYDINGNSIRYANPGSDNAKCTIGQTLQEGYYYVVIDGYNTQTGNFKLSVQGQKHVQRKHQYLDEEEQVNSITESTDIEVFPNPNNGSFYVKANNETIYSTLEIIDTFGKVLDKRIITEVQTEINKDLSSGIYFVKITDKNKSITVKKIVIQK
jgi:hypothetical protein